MTDHPVLPDLDPVIHAVARLRVTVALAALPEGDSITFPRLRELLGLTDGNLSAHLRKLEAAGYVVSEKTFRRRTPVTYVSLTEEGRVAFRKYRTAVRALVALDES
jgi:DNA-binding MarR family transcriptional regulator